MVRGALFADIPAIVMVLQEAYLRTHYAKSGLADMDRAEAKRLLVTSIQRHGGSNGGSTWVQVSETNGVVTGFILGTLTRVYSIGNRLMATDLFWLTSPGADPLDAARLMRGMIEWASSVQHCVEINCGTTAIMNDPGGAGKMLERLGMAKYGNLYRMEIAR